MSNQMLYDTWYTPTRVDIQGYRHYSEPIYIVGTDEDTVRAELCKRSRYHAHCAVGDILHRPWHDDVLKRYRNEGRLVDLRGDAPEDYDPMDAMDLYEHYDRD